MTVLLKLRGDRNTTEAWTIINDNREILDELVRQPLVRGGPEREGTCGDLRADQEGSGSSGGCPTTAVPDSGQAAGGDSGKPQALPVGMKPEE